MRNNSHAPIEASNASNKNSNNSNEAAEINVDQVAVIEEA